MISLIYPLAHAKGYISIALYTHTYIYPLPIGISEENMDYNDIVEMDVERYHIERAKTCARDDIGAECVCNDCINDLSQGYL